MKILISITPAVKKTIYLSRLKIDVIIDTEPILIFGAS